MWKMMDTMTTSEGSVAVGRRTGESGRESYTVEEKRHLVEATQQPGASVSRIARERGLNTNMLFTWRRQHACGELAPSHGAPRPAALLPVCVESASAPENPQPARAVAPPRPGLIEIDLGGGAHPLPSWPSGSDLALPAHRGAAPLRALCREGACRRHAGTGARVRKRASCRPTPTPASRRSTPAARSWKPAAGPTRGERSTRSTRPTLRPLLPKA